MGMARHTLGLLWVLAALACAGCGGGQRPHQERGAPDDVSQDRDREEPADGAASAAGCPATFAEASRLTVACDEAATLRCTYPEGDCYCGEPRQCGGAYPRPMPIGWECAAANQAACPSYPAAAESPGPG